jgi:hypothetical protein
MTLELLKWSTKKTRVRLLWKVKRFKMAAYSGLVVLALTELTAAINNVSVIVNTL